MPAEGKKGSLVIALGLGKKGGASKVAPPDGPMDQKDDEDEAPDGKHAAMQEFMDAVKSGDTASAAEALESFVSMCGDY